MLIGMPSTEIARSVPWSRLKPRRKYWLALPSPLCCVTISPGAASSASAGRENGRALTASPGMFFSLEDVTGAGAIAIGFELELAAAPAPTAAGARAERLL